MRGPERRNQIVEAVISVMAEHGLPGTTTKRIAAKAGVSEPALYRHFSSKKKLVLEALEKVGNTPLQILATMTGVEDNVFDQFIKMSDGFYDFFMDHSEESMLLFEVVAGSRDPEFRMAMSDKFMDYTLIMSTMFEEGKKAGYVREDLDTTVAAWHILALGITLVFASVMGLGDVLTKDKALLAVREILQNIASDQTEGKKGRGV
ncbi:MAG: hypothetical protein A2V52_06800 [Actinobacteria bacterium RBG_19FT_COMBO_54_7]|uniref:HTH tetR-type domain-containing protein n=1 Tax=Candidatus Solincola sediminis TaxID=1797199 RepID=A0A1F2WJ56_9ACTN|nr:MAG: hypothetical protein A2Y75_06850 [Candidatus Solincola sediminis]OFW57543.1 MAG: hypothetical protein A2W01_01935 [Candidatus Solincola sediminis]OFW68007.1 MAG: hypothetical protein A2V52_06800 [Actinobacteria bacterium RBG_19FT_COMBO_54_7]